MSRLLCIAVSLIVCLSFAYAGCPLPTNLPGQWKIQLTDRVIINTYVLYAADSGSVNSTVTINSGTNAGCVFGFSGDFLTYTSVDGIDDVNNTLELSNVVCVGPSCSGSFCQVLPSLLPIIKQLVLIYSFLSVDSKCGPCSRGKLRYDLLQSVLGRVRLSVLEDQHGANSSTSNHSSCDISKRNAKQLAATNNAARKHASSNYHCSSQKRQPYSFCCAQRKGIACLPWCSLLRVLLIFSPLTNSRRNF